MSVQRFDAYGYMPRPEGKNVRYTDHARIVAEAAAEARAAERRHWEARFRNAEQAHAAALAGMYELGKADGHLLGEEKAHRDSVIVHEGAAESRGYRRGLAADPRILTADDPEPAVGSVVLGEDRHGRWQVGVRQTKGVDGRGWAIITPGSSGVPYTFADVCLYGPVTLIHDGEATPQVKPCSTCGEPVAYLTARPGWAGGWLHHPARPLDGHPAAIDGEATPSC